jgi:hypothetical protein
VTLARIVVVVVLIVSGLTVLYGMVLDRSGQNLLFTMIGLAVMGLTLVFVSAWFLSRALADARWGRTGGALSGALMGGLLAVCAAGCLGAASVFLFIRV